MDKITDFLDRGEILGDEDIWQKINSAGSSYPVMDWGMEIVNEEDYYGADFSRDKAVYQIFFSGTSNYFPGIWVPKNDLENMEKYPVYIFDLQSGENEVNCVGNFRHFIEKVVHEFLDNYDQKDEYSSCANQLLLDLQNNFSNDLLRDDRYILGENPLV